MLLALDTTFDACSAALYDVAAGRVLTARFAAMERGHAEAIGPMIEALFAEAHLKPAQLTKIVVTRGPGTFTGLRIGLSFAKGMALALKLPLIGMDSLAATAAPHLGSNPSLVVVHKAGGTGLYYWAQYEGVREKMPPALASIEAIAAQLHDTAFAVVGSGAEALCKLLPHAGSVTGAQVPDAGSFAAFAAQWPPSLQPVEPLYLRSPDARPSVAASPQVRMAIARDVTRLADIHAACFAKGWDSEAFATLLSVTGAGCLIVELSGIPYGFVQYQWVAGEAEINTICVLPNYRRQHFGHDLMAGLIGHLSRLGTSKLFLEVSANNQAARQLYAAFGFRETGVRPRYYADGTDALTMARDLSN